MPVDFETGLIINEFKLNQESMSEKRSIFSYCGIMPSMSSFHKFDRCILHIHGGGFVSMSSSSHQSYTRIWANDCNTVVFSVDYGLAPQHSFPKAVNDCWQVYFWLMEYGELYLGVKPEKIVLCGDSAGGNLAAAVTTMAVQRGFRVPDGLLLAYPALVLTKQNFDPSLLLALDDPILPIAFLNMCLESYAEGPISSMHEYLSPGLASDETLSKFPKTRIMIASNDPLRDMSIVYALRLTKLGVDVKLKEYKLLPHGFLNLDNPVLGMN